MSEWDLKVNSRKNCWGWSSDHFCTPSILQAQLESYFWLRCCSTINALSPEPLHAPWSASISRTVNWSAWGSAGTENRKHSKKILRRWSSRPIKSVTQPFLVVLIFNKICKRTQFIMVTVKTESKETNGNAIICKLCIPRVPVGNQKRKK